MKRTKTQLAKILLDYLDDYYTEYPEEKTEACVNWGELDSYYRQYPDIFPVLVEPEKYPLDSGWLWDFADKTLEYYKANIMN